MEYNKRRPLLYVPPSDITGRAPIKSSEATQDRCQTKYKYSRSYFLWELSVDVHLLLALAPNR